MIDSGHIRLRNVRKTITTGAIIIHIITTNTKIPHELTWGTCLSRYLSYRQVEQLLPRTGLNTVFGLEAFLLKNRRGFDSEAFWHLPLAQTGAEAACSPAIATETINRPSTALYILTSPSTRARHHVENPLSTLL